MASDKSGKGKRPKKSPIHYASQFRQTHANKLRRVRQSSGDKAANAYNAEFLPVAIAKSMKTRKTG